MHSKNKINYDSQNQQPPIKNSNPSSTKNQQNLQTISNYNANENQMPHIIENSKQSINKINNTEQFYSLRNQNKKLRIVNKQLKKQLEQFSKRLDESLKKQAGQEHKYKVGQQILQNKQLKNAYKKCQIYKKQINFLKRKQAQQEQNRKEDLEAKIIQLQKQKQLLIRQIKDLKKINKQQQKGLKQMAGPNAMKLIEENEKLRQSIRRLQMLYDNKQVNEYKGLEKYRSGSQYDKKNFTKQKSKGHSYRKGYDDSKNQLSDGLEDQSFKQKSQFEQLKNKIIRSNRKVTALTLQITKLKSHNQDLKEQMLQRDKQLSYMRQKMIQLRKFQQGLKKKKNQVETELPILKFHKKQQQKSQKHEQHRSSSRHRRFKTQNPIDSSYQNKQYAKYRDPSGSFQTKNSKAHQAYPKTIHYGFPGPSSLKWNHFNFSSKIKQIQICPNSTGWIKQLYFRYEKGQPPKISKSKYASFCCEQNSSQYIKTVKGGFKDGVLRYLFIQSSFGRKASFCQYYLEDECSNWVIQAKPGQYIGAFFGENIEQGICRIGCLIQKQK